MSYDLDSAFDRIVASVLAKNAEVARLRAAAAELGDEVKALRAALERIAKTPPFPWASGSWCPACSCDCQHDEPHEPDCCVAIAQEALDR